MAALRRAWTEEGRAAVDDASYEEAFATWFEREAHQRTTWLAEAGGAVVGMLNLLVFTRMPRPRPAGGLLPPSQWGYVANVYVVPGARDAGVGRLLLDAVVAHADAQGLARLVLSPSERSVAFHERAGFAPATSLMLRPGR
jgi:GNAT superfamily N-acetyltransferase